MPSRGPTSADIRPLPTQRGGPDRAGHVPAKVRPEETRHAPLDRSDAAIRRLAEPQHRVVTLSQLESLGLSARAARHRAASGRLIRLHRGVYGTGHVTVETRVMAAVLACGHDAVASHRAAGALWGVVETPAGEIDVTVATRAGRSRAGIRTHRASSLREDERTTVDGIPCTALPRTLLDLASHVDGRALERAIDRAETLRVFDLDAIRETVRRHHGRPGVRALVRILDAYTGPQIAESAAEERFLSIVRSARLPKPSMNETVVLNDGTAYRADFLWRSAGLVVEIDGRSYHARRLAFEHDRRRDRRLALIGLETRRYAVTELTQRPDVVADEIARFLAAARGSGRSRRA